jgi:hypothetical protein
MMSAFCSLETSKSIANMYFRNRGKVDTGETDLGMIQLDDCNQHSKGIRRI